MAIFLTPSFIIVDSAIQELLIVNKAEAQVIEEPDAPEHVQPERLRFGEINDCVPFVGEDGERYFVPITEEGTRSCGKPLPMSVFDFQPEQTSVGPLENTKRATSVELAEQIDAG
jgi:hypothetical protein